MIKSKSTKFGDYVVVFLCLILIFICLVPMLNVLARSLSDTYFLTRNEVLLWPKGLNLDAYRTVLGNDRYIHSLWYTALLTVGCTVLSLFMTVICAYPLTWFISSVIFMIYYLKSDWVHGFEKKAGGAEKNE